VGCLCDTFSNEPVGIQRSDGKRRAAAEVVLLSLMMRSVMLESGRGMDLCQSTRLTLSEDIELLSKLLLVLGDMERCNEPELSVADILERD